MSIMAQILYLGVIEEYGQSAAECLEIRTGASEVS